MIGWVGVLPGLVCGGLVVEGTIPSLPSIVLTGCGMDGVGRVLELAVLNLGRSCAANSVSSVHLLVLAVWSGRMTTCAGISRVPSVNALLDLIICKICLTGFIPFSCRL